MKNKRLILTILAAFTVFAAVAQSEAPDFQALLSANNVPTQNNKAGYNASIFTKSGDTLASFYFAADNQGYTTGTFSSTNPAPATVTGQVNHGQSGYYSTWHRIPNVAYLNSSNFSVYYPRFDQYFMKEYVAAVFSDTMSWGAFDDNGFMLMSCYDQQQIDVSKAFNAYFELDEIDASAAAVVDVRFLQFYMKFYDTCYIDYTDATGTWHSMEININGINCDINSWNARGQQLYTLPLAAAGNQHLKIRFRWYSKARSTSQAIYGYVWAIDNVTVHAGAASSLQRYDEHYVEGAYGMIPQGMQLPLSWYAPVNNNGAISQTNVAVNIYSLNSDKTVIGTSATGTQPDIAAGNGTVDLTVEGRDNVAASRGWLGYSTSYLDNTFAPSNNGLNTATDGLHYATATLTTADINIEGAYDTIPYIVTTNDDNGFYTWGYDNGLLLASSTGFRAGYVISNGNLYTTDNAGGYNLPGYSVSNRYTTGSVIPTNDDGEKWVIRGIEIVPAATPNSSQYVGAQIRANLYVDEYGYEGGAIYFRNSDFFHNDTVRVTTGAGTHTVTADELNTTAGYYFPGNYNTIRIMFPEQPELHPNTSYRIGYTLEEGHEFEVAVMGTTYATLWDAEGNTTTARLRDDSTLKTYAYNFGVDNYDTYITDPTDNDDPGRFGWGSPIPLIRMLVGPKVEIPQYTVAFNYTGDGTISYGNQTFDDGATHTFAEGSFFTIKIQPDYENATATIYVDGNLIEPYDEIVDEGDPNLYYDGVVYYYTFTNIQSDHTLQVVFGDAVIDTIDCSTPVYAPFGTNDFSQPGDVPITECWTTTGWTFYGNWGLTRGNNPLVSSFIQLPYDAPCKFYFATAGVNAGGQYSYQVNVYANGNTYSLGTRTFATVTDTYYDENTGENVVYSVLIPDSVDLAQFAGQIVKVEIIPVTIDYEFYFQFYGVVYSSEEYSIEISISGQNQVAVDHRIVLTATATQNGDETINYYWDNTGSGLPIEVSESGNQATFMWFEPGTFTVTATAYNFRGMAQASHIVTVVADTTAHLTDTVWMPGDTVRIVETEYIHDSIYLPSDTVIVIETEYLHDTTYVYRDTLTLVDTVVDTFYVYLDTLYLYDTVYIHDTIEVGIDSVETDGLQITIGVGVGTITVDGTEGRSVQLYDAVGRLLATRREYGRVTFNVPSTGAYVIKVDGVPAKKVVVFRGNN